MLAGAVTAGVVNGNLLVDGDRAGNEITVTRTGAGEYRVDAGDGGTVNGEDSVTLSGVDGAVRIDLGGGADALTLATDATPGNGPNVRVRTGAGRDVVTLAGLEANDLRINLGTNGDTLVTAGPPTELAGDLTVGGGRGAGRDSVDLDELFVAGDVKLCLGAGADDVRLEEALFERDLHVRLGGGDDVFEMVGDSDVGGALDLDASAGTDLLDFRDSAVRGAARVLLGSGNDVIVFNGLLVEGDAVLRGGLGTDRLISANGGGRVTSPDQLDGRDGPLVGEGDPDADPAFFERDLLVRSFAGFRRAG